MEIIANIPEYTVSEISVAVKLTLETAFERVRVAGEITEVRRYPSGHLYFSLKDEGGKLAAVVWRQAVARLGVMPENGLAVVATGRITAYGERSTYQLIVERVDYAGEGALLARIEALRRRLAEEGLFDILRKRPLPLLPRVIGVITSEQGAVIQDIRTTIARRFPRPIILWPVPVQGEGAARKIAAAIAGFGTLPLEGPIPRPDVLIVARGGGSLEDLMAFNDEAVVRAAVASPVPLISAVGHETDTTLIDFAADRRVPTPTAAAELAVPVRVELMAGLAQWGIRLTGGLRRLMQEYRLRLESIARILPDLPGYVGTTRQRLDDRAERLLLALRVALQALRSAIAASTVHLREPLTVLGAGSARLEQLFLRLGANLERTLAADRGGVTALGGRLSPVLIDSRLRAAHTQLEGLSARLASLSPDAVLARGYTLVFDASGRLLGSATAVTPAAALQIHFRDGTVDVRAAASRQKRLPLLE